MSTAQRQACRARMHVIAPDGRWLSGGRAWVWVLQELGWRRAAWVLARPPAIWAVEAANAVVSTHRPFFARFLFRKEPLADPEVPEEN